MTIRVKDALQGLEEKLDGSKESVDSADAKPPFLLVDLYPLDEGPRPPWNVLVNSPLYYGAIIKASQGISSWYNDKGWFKTNWPALREAGGAHSGTTWLRGAYHFLNFWQSGKDQADFYLSCLEQAGGLKPDDIVPIVDVEQGGERNPNRRASKQEVIDCTMAWVTRVKERTGRRVCLYGRGAMRDLRITSKMGCDVVWNPSYTSVMVKNGIIPPWTLDEIGLWQYCGDGDATFDKLPKFIQGFGDGKVDISVHIDGARKPTLNSLHRAMVE
jgi:hypothetical protein